MASEYYTAARAVSLQAKPLLIYYSIMNFALAETLFKQSGDISLDRAREQHRHHGLKIIFPTSLDPNDSLVDSASRLKAEPMRDAHGKRVGTFELWHRSAREYPIAGKSDDYRLSISKHRTVLAPSGDRLPPVGDVGLSLLDALKMIPSLGVHLSRFGVDSDLVRTQLTQTIREDSRQTVLVVHPTVRTQLDRFLSCFLVSPRTVPHIEVTESKGGGHAVKITGDADLKLPPGSNINKDEVYFSCFYCPLNEFGYYYYAFFIVGNLVRYFPDFWIRHVAESSDLAILVEALCADFTMRVPLLALSELERTFILRW